MKRLDMDVKRLCYELIDLLLTNLPKPDIDMEFMQSRALMDGIHKYIQHDLLQNAEEESV